MPHCDDRPIRSPAFTLVELLAVLVILSLVVGLGARGLASSHSATTLRESMAAVHDLDRKARIFARTQGAIRLTVIDDGHSIALLDHRTRERVFQMSLPDGITVSIETTVAAESIVFDRSGRTLDYRVNLHAADRSTRVDVSGLTGQAITQTGGRS